MNKIMIVVSKTIVMVMLVLTKRESCDSVNTSF